MAELARVTGAEQPSGRNGPPMAVNTGVDDRKFQIGRRKPPVFLKPAEFPLIARELMPVRISKINPPDQGFAIA